MVCIEALVLRLLTVPTFLVDDHYLVEYLFDLQHIYYCMVYIVVHFGQPLALVAMDEEFDVPLGPPAKKPCEDMIYLSSDSSSESSEDFCFLLIQKMKTLFVDCKMKWYQVSKLVFLCQKTNGIYIH